MQYLTNTKKAKAVSYSFAARLKSSCHTLLGVNPQFDSYEYCKDTILSEFMYMSPRQFYIKYSEECIKPILGKEFFGSCFVNWVENTIFDDSTVIVSDCGFKEEILPIINKFGAKAVTIIQLEKPGCDFRNDSRGYISNPNVKTYHIHNNDSLAEFYTKLEEVVKEILA
jgi:hypothetical protein